MEIANGTESFARRFHRVTADRAVHMQIDKTRCKIISVEIDDLIFAMRAGPFACPRRRWGSRANRSDFSLFDDNFKPVANSIGKNQTRVAKDHFARCSRLNDAVYLGKRLGSPDVKAVP